MKMLRCTSSPDKNAVLMSPNTNFHLCDATHCKIKASACAENMGCLEELLSGLDLKPANTTQRNTQHAWHTTHAPKAFRTTAHSHSTQKATALHRPRTTRPTSLPVRTCACATHGTYKNNQISAGFADCYVRSTCA